MKYTASIALIKARVHADKIKELLLPINAKLSDVLGNDAHIVDQPGDGYCICYNDGKIAGLFLLDIDVALKMNKDELLRHLDNASI